jgi:hypothetical protein
MPCDLESVPGLSVADGPPTPEEVVGWREAEDVFWRTVRQFTREKDREVMVGIYMNEKAHGCFKRNHIYSARRALLQRASDMTKPFKPWFPFLGGR